MNIVLHVLVEGSGDDILQLSPVSDGVTASKPTEEDTDRSRCIEPIGAWRWCWQQLSLGCAKLLRSSISIPIFPL